MRKNICRTTTALLIVIWLSMPSCRAAQKPAVKASTSPTVRLEVRRLADLNVPRNCHLTFVAGGDVVVVGGHTSGFVPTATAEYLHGGKWHLLNTVYSHDQATSLPMRSGKVMITGGIKDSNFSPYSTVVLLPVGDSKEFSEITGLPVWIILAVLLAVVAIAAAIYIIMCNHKKKALAQRKEAEKGDKPSGTSATATYELMQKIDYLMNEKRIYLNSDCKLSDIASLLGTNSRYVSESIKQHKGIPFTQYVNGYRIAHAQRLLTTDPDMKLAAVCVESGFSNETTFFRIFKAITGMTPGEWLREKNG